MKNRPGISQKETKKTKNPVASVLFVSFCSKPPSPIDPAPRPTTQLTDRRSLTFEKPRTPGHQSHAQSAVRWQATVHHSKLSGSGSLRSRAGDRANRPRSGKSSLHCNGRNCSQAAMKFFGVRPQQRTHGWTIGITPTPPSSRRFCARGRAHSGCLRLRRAESLRLCVETSAIKTQRRKVAKSQSINPRRARRSTTELCDAGGPEPSAATSSEEARSS